MNTFGGDLTDTSAEKASLMTWHTCWGLAVALSGFSGFPLKLKKHPKTFFNKLQRCLQCLDTRHATGHFHGLCGTTLDTGAAICNFVPILAIPNKTGSWTISGDTVCVTGKLHYDKFFWSTKPVCYSERLLKRRLTWPDLMVSRVQ